MYTKNFGVDLNGGHLVEGLDKLLLPRQELLFGSVQSQKSQQLLELHRKYKRRLMHPLQVNKQLRVMKELDFLVPERDFLTWVQFSGLEANPEVEKLMEHVKNISSVSQQVFRGRSVEDTKVPPKPLRKEDFLKKNLPKDVYKKVKIAKKKDQDPEEADQEQEKMSRDTLGPEEEDTTTLEDQDEKEIEAEDEETLMKQLSEIQHNKKNLKQLNNNVYFRYTKRKLLLLRSLGSLPSKEEIVKTFFQKTENNYHEKDKELRDKLKQELSNDARLILTHKKNLYEFHQKLRGRGNITIEDMIKRCSSVNLDNQEKERVTGPTAATENFDTARGIRTSYKRGEYSSNPGKAQPEAKQVFPSTLQHLDEVPSSGAIDSENVEKETKPSIVNIKSSRRLVKDHRGTTSLATFDSATIKSQALMSTRCQTRQDMTFEERRRKLQSESKVFERLSAESSARKGGSKSQRSPDPIPRGKPIAFTKTNGPNLQTEQRLKTPLRCVSKGKIMEMANRTPERPMTTLKSIMRRPPQTSRLETEPENTSSYRDDRPPSKELDTMRMQQTERCLERAWNKEPVPRNTIGHGPERKTVKGDTEAILSSVLEHGRKKREKVPLPEDKRKEQEELTTRIGKQLQEFFSYRKDVSKLTDPLEYTSVMVKICPEIQTIYNLRKEIIQQRLETMNSKEKHAFLIKELMSLLPLMKQNPKSYCLWHHRKWCFIKGLEVEKEDPTIEKILAKQEFGLCEMQLAKDERNFHVWNYRSWIVNTLKALDQNVIDKELKFIDSKLEANFSNFSALHFKSKNLLAKYTLFLQDLNEKKVSELEDPKLVKDVLLYGLPLDTIKAELETVKTGLYMQSAEQSMWLYHQWLIDRIIPIRVKYVKFFGKTDKGVTLGLLFSQKIMNLNHHTLRISRASEDKNLEFEIQPVGTGKFTNAFRITVLADGPVDKLVIRLLNPDKVLEAQGESELGDAIEYCIVSSEGKRLVADSPCQVELAGEHKCTYYSQETSEREKELSNLVEEQRKVILEILELEPDSRFAHSQLIYVIHNKEEPYSNTKEGLQKRLELNQEVVKSSENLLQKNPEKANRFAYFLKLYKLKSRILESLKEGDLAKAREIEQTEEAKSINLGEIADLLLLSDVKIANNEVSNLITLFNQSASNE